MTSAFGIEHISKYSREYGSAREVPDHTTRRKLRPLPDTERITLRKKRIKKSYTKIAPKLMRAAAKGDRYAAQRLAAGSQGKKVAYHLNEAKAANSSKVSPLNPRARKARATTAKVSTIAAGMAQRTGTDAAQAAKKTAGSISAANYATGSGVRGATEAKPKLFSSGNKIMGASVLGGAAAGGGGAIYANQRRKSA